MTTTARRGEATRGAIIDKRLRSHLSRVPDAKEINNSHGPEKKLKASYWHLTLGLTKIPREYITRLIRHTRLCCHRAQLDKHHTLTFGSQSYQWNYPAQTNTWYLKCYCDENSWYPIFLHFRLEYVILSHPAKFQLITTTGSVFFGPFSSRFYGRHYWLLFRKLTHESAEVTS